MKAVYAGSFDPVTYGHLSIIQSASGMFEELYIVIAKNHNKNHSIPFDTRVEFLNELIEEHGLFNCVVNIIENDFLISYALEHDCDFIVRGLRNEIDFGYEKAMKHINDDISNKKIDSVYLIPPRELCEVSSSMVKGLVGINGWEPIVSKYVPRVVLDYYKRLNKKDE